MFSRVPVRLFSIFVAIVVLFSISTTLFAEIHTTARPQVRVTARVDNSKRTTLYGHVSGAIRMSKDMGRMDPGTPTGRMIMVLNSDDEQKRELRRVIDEQHDKRTANYHQWLKPEDFGARFGVHDSDISQVETWLKSQGFTVEDVSKSKRVIHFSGTTGQLEKAFKTQMHSYQHRGKTEVANNGNISIPTALSPVIAGVTVHSSFRSPRKNPLVGKVHLSRKEKPDFGDVSGNYVGPADFATIYNTNPLLAAGITGTGSSIAIVGDSDVWMSDIQVYRQMFNLPVNDPTIIYAGQNNGIIAGDDQEADSDIELAGSIAPGATIYYVDGSSNLLVDGVTNAKEYVVENNLADIISDSYPGGCELNANNAFENQLWEQAAAQGQSVFVAADNVGPEDCDSASDAFGVGGYAVTSDSTPYNVSVGGTTFNEGSGTYWSTTPNPVSFESALSYIPEIAWNEATASTTGNSTTGAGIYSSGGGISAYYLKPAWQQGPGVPTTDPTVAGNLWVPQYGGVIITGGGSGYTKTPTVTFTGGGCSEEPSATATLTSGVVTAITMNYGSTGGGFGCTSAPTVSFTAAPTGGTTATAYAVVVPPLAPAPLVSGVPHRYLPDVVLDANDTHDPTLFCTEGDCQIDSDGSIDNYDTEGATQTATPEMAGIQALINQANGGRQGMPNYYYYSLAAAQNTAACNSSNITSTACAFQDVTSGSNLICATLACAEGGANPPLPDKAGWTAGAGYDLATGLGSPNAANLASQWSTVTFNSSNTTLNLSQTTGIAQGTPITFSGTVAAGSGSGTPTGDVAFILSQGIFGETITLGGSPFVTLNNGTYSTTLDNLPAGTYTVTARYAGDGNFASSLSAPVTVTVGQGSSTVTITPQTFNTSTCDTAAATSFAYGSIMMIQVTVAGASGEGEPTGTVTITQNGTTYANLPLDPTGNAFVYAGSIFPSGNGSGLQGCTNSNLYEGSAQSATQLPAGSYTIGATYSGDSTFTPGTAATVPITITKLSTTPTLTAGQTEIATGAKVTLTATFSDTSLDSYTLTGAAPPTGSITFKNGSTTLGTATLVPQIIYSVGGPNGDSPEYTYAAAASLATTAITTTGSNSITAVYAGDNNYNSETSSALAITVATGTATTTTLTSSANPTPVGAQPTLTATVSGSPTSGTVTFYDGTTVLGSTKLSTKTKGGVVTYTSLGGTSSSASSKGTTSQPGLAAGTHSLTAAYSGATGSPALLASTSAVYSQVISQVSIDISLSTKTVGKAGQAYIFSANLACDAAGCDSGNFQNYFPPTLSNVQFYDGSTLLGSAPALTVSSNDGGFSDWAAQFSTSSLSPGTHTITATYADTNYSLSTSNAQTVFVGGTPTLTWTTPAAIAYGTALSATQLNATDTIPGTFVYSPASGTIPGVGTQTLRVNFTPADYTDFGPQTTTVSLLVNKASTAIAVTNVSPAAEDYGSTAAVTVTAQLTWSGAGATPTAADVVISGSGLGGTVGGTTCGAPSGDTLTCTATYSPNGADLPGSYTFSAAFAGDSNYNSSSSSQTGNFTINSATSTTSVSTSGSPSNFGQSVTFTATINGENGNVKSGAKANKKKPQIVTGNVTWSANTGCGSTAVTSGNPGTATCTTTALPVGGDVITATYSGDSNHGGSSGTLSPNQQVNGSPTTISVTNVSPAAEEYGSTAVVTITAQLAWTGAGVPPTATSSTVTFSDAALGGTFGTASCGAASGDTINCTGTYTPSGLDLPNTYTIVAAFSGDSNYSNSSSLQTNNFSINSASSTTSVSTSGSPSNFGQSVTFTATINGENGNVKSGAKANKKKPQIVTGNVTWSANTGCGSTAVTAGNPGTASCTTSTVPAGSAVITASYSGDSNHSGSSGTLSPNQQVNQASQTITFTTNAPSEAADTSSFTVAATASSGLTVSFSVGGGSVCTLSGATYTMTSGTGNCYVVASQSGNSNYLAAIPVTETVHAGLLAQAITFSTNAPSSATYNTSFSVAATGGASGNAVTFTAAGVCGITAGGSNSATYTMNSGTGTCSVIANQAGNGNYTAAPTVTKTVNATLASQTITFTTPAPPAAEFLGTFTVAATGGASGNPVAFSVGAGSVCTLSSATYTMTAKVGNCYVVANQTGNSNYAAATQVTETVVAKAGPPVRIAPTVTFTGAPTSAPYLSSFSGLMTTQNNGVTPTFSVTTASACSISGSTVTMKTGNLSCTVKASWAETTYYSAATLTQTVSATPLSTTTTITGTAPKTNPLKVTVSFAVNDGSPLTGSTLVTVTSAAGPSCSGTLTAGSCTLTFSAPVTTSLTASFPGTTDYTGSTSASYPLTVN